MSFGCFSPVLNALKMVFPAEAEYYVTTPAKSTRRSR